LSSALAVPATAARARLNALNSAPSRSPARVLAAAELAVFAAEVGELACIRVLL
jgi:hypothetical protein